MARSLAGFSAAPVLINGATFIPAGTITVLVLPLSANLSSAWLVLALTAAIVGSGRPGPSAFGHNFGSSWQFANGSWPE
jgi:hypothetical protein